MQQDFGPIQAPSLTLLAQIVKLATSINDTTKSSTPSHLWVAHTCCLNFCRICEHLIWDLERKSLSETKRWGSEREKWRVGGLQRIWLLTKTCQGYKTADFRFKNAMFFSLLCPAWEDFPNLQWPVHWKEDQLWKCPTPNNQTKKEFSPFRKV